MATLEVDECARRAEHDRSARLATHRSEGGIDLVPIVYAFVKGDLVFAIDHKPKSTQRLQRLDNIAADPQVTVLFDRYDDDWTQLWWVRMHGVAREVSTPDARSAALDALVAKYSQYSRQRPDGPVVQVHPTRWTGWSYT